MTLKLKHLLFLLPLVAGLIYFNIDRAAVEETSIVELSAPVSIEKNEEQKFALIKNIEVLNKKEIDRILEEEDEAKALEVLESKDLDKKDLAYFIENLAYFDEPAVVSKAKKELTSVLKEGDLETVVQFLPTVVHFDMDKTENQKLVESFCRFEQREEYGFEVLKLLLNRIPRFQKNEFRLSSNCNGAA